MHFNEDVIQNNTCFNGLISFIGSLRHRLLLWIVHCPNQNRKQQLIDAPYMVRMLGVLSYLKGWLEPMQICKLR